MAALAVAVALGATLTACSGGPATKANGAPGAHGVTTTLRRAIADADAGRTAQAVAGFLAVVKAQPANHVAWYDLGVIAQKLGQDKQAEHDYSSAIAGDGRYVPALYNLAILETKAHPQSARSLYQKAVTYDPSNASVHLNYGFLLESLGQQTAGQEELAKAVQLDPTLASRIPSNTTTTKAS